jgi:hypothetical protein
MSSSENASFENMRWPEWIMSSGPDSTNSLAAISGCYERIKPTIVRGYVYEHVMQKEINAVYVVLGEMPMLSHSNIFVTKKYYFLLQNMIA